MNQLETSQAEQELKNLLNHIEGNGIQVLVENFDRSKKLWMDCGGTMESWLEYIEGRITAHDSAKA